MSIDDIVGKKMNNTCCPLNKNMNQFVDKMINNGIRFTIEPVGKYDARTDILTQGDMLIDMLKRYNDIIECSFAIINGKDTVFFNYLNKKEK